MSDSPQFRATQGFCPLPLTLRGTGSRVLLFDSGIPTQHMLGERFRNLALEQGGREQSARGDDHAHRTAYLCADLAPDCELLSALYSGVQVEELPVLFAFICSRYGRVDVMGHCYSLAEDSMLATQGRRAASLAEHAFDKLPLIVASPGHDGPMRLRFPGSLTDALSIGVCDAEGHPTAYCGAEKTRGKPDLYLTDHRYRTLRADGTPTSIGGTSAAVALVCGLAALWFQRLRALNVEPPEVLVRAVLMLDSEVTPAGTRRLGSHVLADERKKLQWRVLTVNRSNRLRVRVTGSMHFRLAVTSVACAPSAWWVSQDVQLHLQRKNAVDAQTPEASEPRQIVLDVADPSTLAHEWTLSFDGPVRGVAIVTWGASTLEVERIPATLGRGRQPGWHIGVSASHDAAAALINPETRVCAIALERLTRVKHDGENSLALNPAIEYCLSHEQIDAEQLQGAGFNIQALRPGYAALSQALIRPPFPYFDPLAASSTMASHHLCHAIAAFCTSGLDSALVVVADGSGGTTLGCEDVLLPGTAVMRYLNTSASAVPQLHWFSAYEFDRRSFRLIYRASSPSFNVRCGFSSPGEAYASTSQYVFGDWRDSGKLMGLAPYGEADRWPSFLQDSSQPLKGFRFPHELSVLGPAGRDPMVHRDLAARLQADFAAVLGAHFREALARSTCRQIAYAGGLALNCVNNQKLRAELDISMLHIMPAAGDAGVAVGAAAASWHVQHREFPMLALQGDHLGHPYGPKDYELALNDFAGRLQIEPLSFSTLIERLLQGQAIGVLRGGSEFGPRALGHRSILASPVRRATWERINRCIKYREDFRPFAPVVPESLASVYFEMYEPSPFMLRVFNVRPEFRERLEAVTHVDGSARVQTVSAEQDPWLHELLLAFGLASGVSCLLNTSLNVSGQPLVETPRHALEVLLSSGLDALVLGEALVTRKSVPADFDRCGQLHLAPGVTRLFTSRDGTARHWLSKWRGIEEVELPLSALASSNPAHSEHGLFDTSAVSSQELRNLVDRGFLNWCAP